MKRLNLKYRVLGLAVVATVAGARAADPRLAPPNDTLTVSLQSPRPEPLFFWQRFDAGFDDNVNDTFADALQPLNSIRWNLDLPGPDFSDNFRERASSEARAAFIKSSEFGAREAVVELPFMAWLDEHQGWLADLLRGSIGNVSEEAVSPLGISYQGVERSWWRSVALNGTHYGFRPFRTDPYAYVSHAITDGGGNTVLLANVRYYYDHFSDHRFELALSVPVAYGVDLDVGTSCQFGTHDARKCAVKLVKELRGGGVAHLGVEVRTRPMLIAGITFPW